MESINKSFRLEYMDSDNPNIIKMKDPSLEETHCITIDGKNILCSCSKYQNFHLPCSHLIKLFRDRKDLKDYSPGFPISYIHQRFIQTSMPITSSPNIRTFSSIEVEENSDNDQLCNDSYPIDDSIIPEKTALSEAENRRLLIRESMEFIDLIKSSKEASDFYLNELKTLTEKYMHTNGIEIDPSAGKGSRRMRRFKAPHE